MVVTETNNPGSRLIFQGAEIYPFALHFPNDPVGFSGYSQFAITTLGPGVSAADFGSGVVTSVIPNETQPLYGGWKNLGTNTYNPLMTSTAPDGLPTFLPHQDRPVVPGASWSYTVSLRFTPEGTAALASDAYSSFAQTYPSQMTWTDRRIVGTAYLASSPDGSAGVNQPGGFPTNPRRYFNDSSVDITNPTGLQAFQKRMLAQASSNVVNAVAMNSQGVITWDIEGEQFPQNTSYVCSPDQIAVVAPEMESIILDPASAYFGLRLDDAYFKTMSSAGLRTGVCLRPQRFTLLPNGTASQVVLSTNAEIIANLENKARFANARWGTSLFYVDSTVDSNGGTLDPAIFQQLVTDLPSFLFIPEESTPRYYAYTAPFYSFIFHTDLGTPASIYKVYPTAFGANLVNDVSASTLANYLPQLTQSVRNGDILMGHADYWQANDPTLVSIYENAGVGAAPVQATPVISWPVPAAIAYGTPLSGTQLSASANTSGSFTYTPAAGTLLPAGTNNLMTTFTPADAKDYTSCDSDRSAVRPESYPRAQLVFSGADHHGGSFGRGTAGRRREPARHLHLYARSGSDPASGDDDPAGVIPANRCDQLPAGHSGDHGDRNRGSACSACSDLGNTSCDCLRDPAWSSGVECVCLHSGYLYVPACCRNRSPCRHADACSHLCARGSDALHHGPSKRYAGCPPGDPGLVVAHTARHRGFSAIECSGAGSCFQCHRVLYIQSSGRQLPRGGDAYLDCDLSPQGCKGLRQRPDSSHACGQSDTQSGALKAARHFGSPSAFSVQE